MCYAGGPRCSNGGRLNLEKAQDTYERAKNGRTKITILDAKRELDRAEAEYYLTPEGIEKLKLTDPLLAQNRQQTREAMAAAREAAGIKEDTHSSDEEKLAELKADREASRADEENPFTKKYESPKEQISAFQEELNDHIQHLGEGDNYATFLQMIGTFSKYSPTNQLLIALQSDGKATEIKSFKAWHAEGVSVLKGTKSIKILAPVKWKKETDKEDEDGNAIVKQGLGFRAISMFDRSQTSARTIESITKLPTTPPAGFADDLHTAIQESGYTVRYVDDLNFSTHGYTDPVKKEVVISRRWDEAGQAKTLAHELAHIKAGHVDDFDEYRTHRGKYECEAESTAYVICRANGMGTELNDYSASYVKGWTKQAPNLIKDTAYKVSTVSKDILNSFKFRNVAGGQDEETA